MKSFYKVIDHATSGPAGDLVDLHVSDAVWEQVEEELTESLWVSISVMCENAIQDCIEEYPFFLPWVNCATILRR